MSNAFEYGDALLLQPTSDAGAEPDDEKGIENENEPMPRPRIESNQPYLNLAT
jgi:hypothetical protein